MFSSESWLSNQQAGFYNGVATQSLRFDDGSSPYLTRTPSSTGNRRTYTISCWVKRSDLNTTAYIFKANTGTGDALAFRNHSTGTSPFTLYWFFADTAQGSIASTAVFRDVSSWYHVVLAVDTTQSTDTNRLKMYVNGTLLELGITNYPQQNYDSTVNTQVAHLIGAYASGNSHYDGYMSEFNFVDGLALDPTYFGETKNGVWIPIKYTGSYGTNGFRLQFDQVGVGTASTSTIGADTSGNTHHFTSSGIVASDCNMPDSPENNFCTLNPIIRPYEVTPAETASDGNLNAFFNSNAVSGSYWSTFLLTSGKWYFEVNVIAIGGNADVGISNKPSDAGRGTYTGDARGNGYFYQKDGQKGINNTFSSYGATYTTGDIIGCAFDLDNNTITFFKNNASQGQISSVATPEDGFIPAIEGFNGTRLIANFGQDSSFAGNETAQGNTDGNGIGDFYYAPPSGYLALCTSNLPEPTISPNADTQADDYFTPYIWTGNDTNPRAFTDVGFQADWIWIKKRSGSGTSHHLVADSSRGDGKTMLINEVNAEATNDINGTVSDTTTVGGFTVNAGSSSDEMVNDGSDTYVAWLWKANGGTTSSNTDGSITSTVQASTEAGFSIVTYTGTGANATVGHGLSKSPEMVIMKNRSVSEHWRVWHMGLSGGTYYVDLNRTNAQNSTGTILTTTPTSSVFAVGTDPSVSGNGNNLIAYCFHSVEGYSKIGGTYTGNGSTDGTFVFTGFRPAWILYKNVDASGDWELTDTARNPENDGSLVKLEPNNSGVDSARDLDILSNGFKFRNSSNSNTAHTYIYMAFAEVPFKYANGR